VAELRYYREAIFRAPDSPPAPATSPAPGEAASADA